MSEPFIGEIRMWGISFNPKGWAYCSGQRIEISQNQSLYALLGSAYGGDDRTYFNLPDMRGRVPIHQGVFPEDFSYRRGELGGEDAVTLNSITMAAHTHSFYGTEENGTAAFPKDNMFFAKNSGKKDEKNYSDPSDLVQMAPETVLSQGGSLPHNNVMPTLAVNFCIALQGLFPSRN